MLLPSHLLAGTSLGNGRVPCLPLIQCCFSFSSLTPLVFLICKCCIVAPARVQALFLLLRGRGGGGSRQDSKCPSKVPFQGSGVWKLELEWGTEVAVQPWPHCPPPAAALRLGYLAHPTEPWGLAGLIPSGPPHWAVGSLSRVVALYVAVASSLEHMTPTERPPVPAAGSLSTGASPSASHP